jgi:hypothetical protein
MQARGAYGMASVSVRRKTNNYAERDTSGSRRRIYVTKSSIKTGLKQISNAHHSLSVSTKSRHKI